MWPYHLGSEGKCTSILDTTPFVTEMVSPPSGYPTTVTESYIKKANK